MTRTDNPSFKLISLFHIFTEKTDGPVETGSPEAFGLNKPKFETKEPGNGIPSSLIRQVN
jgi:hypothetical protein